MEIDQKRCTDCGACAVYCPVGAIFPASGMERTRIDQGLCVECGTCRRGSVCPAPGALHRRPLRWPRTLRRRFSDPLTIHAGTGIPGRGTEEMKTNDVTGRLRPGRAGLSIDMGRPGVSATFKDIQTIASICAASGARFEPRNPLTALMTDPARGLFDSMILGERILSAIIEAEIGRRRLPALLISLKRAECGIDTVFSVGITLAAFPADRLRELKDKMRQSGLGLSPNGKINLGLGRPLLIPRGGRRA